MPSDIGAPAGLRVRPLAERLGPGASAVDVARAAAGSDGLVCLLGSWARGGSLVTSDPLAVAPAADAVRALGSVPVVEGSTPPGFVGGGWFGWFGYDGPSRMAFHDWVLRRDRDGVWWFEALWSDRRDALLHARREECVALLESPPVAATWRVGDFGGASMPRHLRAVERAVELIRAGEIYQVNVCTRLAAEFDGSAVGLFADAAAALSPAYGALVDTGAYALASLSPELFLRRRGRDVVTAPIKGTRPRDDSDSGAAELRSSVKDAAENVMIVDLMRNDLGRVCEVGSVRAASLLDVEAHPGVWHLVSTVTGRLRDDLADDDLLQATLPPGSVTGAPKLRAVQAIAEIEDRPRGTYTGAIGFASPVWGAEFAVAIRTFEITQRAIELGVGGGVTADSVPVLEWRECLHKAAPLLGALGARLADEVATPDCPVDAGLLSSGVFETLLAVDGIALRVADHLARLDRSCRELYGFGNPADLPARVALGAASVPSGRGRLRVDVLPNGRVTVTAVPAGPPPGAAPACTVVRELGLWRHKWTSRARLADDEGRSAPGVPLYVAADGTVLETSRGSVFLLGDDGTLVTPPLRDDLLPGVTRRALLDLARDTGRPSDVRPFDIGELRASAAFWTSSLSGAVPLTAVDGAPLPRRDEEVARLSAALTRPHSDVVTRELGGGTRDR